MKYSNFYIHVIISNYTHKHLVSITSDTSILSAAEDLSDHLALREFLKSLDSIDSKLKCMKHLGMHDGDGFVGDSFLENLGQNA